MWHGGSEQEYPRGGLWGTRVPRKPGAFSDIIPKSLSINSAEFKGLQVTETNPDPRGRDIDRHTHPNSQMEEWQGVNTVEISRSPEPHCSPLPLPGDIVWDHSCETAISSCCGTNR
jgi:hypothetical protein